MKKWIGMLMLLTAVVAPSAFAVDYYAAISFSESTGRYGDSYNFTRLEDAMGLAQANCGMGDCKVVAWVRNGCTALSVGAGNAWGWAWNTNRANAENRALSECRNRTTGCFVQTSVCTSGFGF